MKKSWIVVVAFVLASLGLTGAHADAALLDLFDWTFNIDGTVYSAPDVYSPPDPGQLPASINTSLFNFSTGGLPGSGGGLGQITITVTGAGSHSVIAFFDHEIDESVNTYFNEFGTAVGTPDTGQSWEIDEPGYVFGDIYTNVLAGTLDNTNGVPAGGENDVSMALGWDFSLAATESGRVTLLLSEAVPQAALYLSQTDPDSDYSIYYSSSLGIRSSEEVPEPGTMLLVATGLVGLAGLRRRMKG